MDNWTDNRADNSADNRADKENDVNEKKLHLFKRKTDVNDKRYKMTKSCVFFKKGV